MAPTLRSRSASAESGEISESGREKMKSKPKSKSPSPPPPPPPPKAKGPQKITKEGLDKLGSFKKKPLAEREARVSKTRPKGRPRKEPSPSPPPLTRAEKAKLTRDRNKRERIGSVQGTGKQKAEEVPAAPAKPAAPGKKAAPEKKAGDVKKATAAVKKKPAVAKKTEVTDDEDSEPVPPGRLTARKKAAPKKTEATDDEDEPPVPPTQVTTRKKAAVAEKPPATGKKAATASPNTSPKLPTGSKPDGVQKMRRQPQKGRSRKWKACDPSENEQKRAGGYAQFLGGLTTLMKQDDEGGYAELIKELDEMRSRLNWIGGGGDEPDTDGEKELWEAEQEEEKREVRGREAEDEEEEQQEEEEAEEGGDEGGDQESDFSVESEED